MTTLKGKCHCGQTEWEVTLDKPTHILCHCGACKYIAGSDYTVNQLVAKDNFKVTKGEAELKKYTYTGDSGNPVHCYSCPNCTSHAYHHQTAAGDQYVVRTSMLEGNEKWDVSAEIYTGQKYNWQPIVAPTEAAFEGGPPS